MYSQEMLERYIPKRTVRLSNALQLKVPCFKNKTLGVKTFGYAVASLWNSIP